MKKLIPRKSKFRKVITSSAIQLIIALMLVNAAIATSTTPQLLERKITISISDVSFDEAIREIGLQAHIKIFYSIDQLQVNENVSIAASDVTLRKVLDELLTPHNIGYKVYERDFTILLKKQKRTKELGEQGRPNTNLRLFDGPTFVVLTGKVIDASTMLPMAGVNILVKGTSHGTTTDTNGNFVLETAPNNILVFSFIGFKSVEIDLRGQTVLDVSMESDVATLQEVEINAGYWKVKKEEQTGNIGRVKSEDIEKQPVSNPLAAMQGRVAGLEIIQSNGVPGSNFKVRIRGTNSLSNGNDPLYIIDGVPYMSSSMAFRETSLDILGIQGNSPLNNINPSDIESIEVLKDADATAIYGSRGSNGVILITTKKGLEGKTKVDFNFYTGVSQVPKKIDLLSTSQYLEMRKEAYANDGMEPSPADAPDLMLWDTTRYTNWQKELIGGTASTTDAQVSISGGEKNTQFLIGTGFHRETTVFPGENADQRVSLHASINNKSAGQKLKTSFSVNYSSAVTRFISQDLTYQALNLSPNAPALYDENGDINWEGWSPSLENPLAYLDRQYQGTTNNLTGNLVVNYAVLPNLIFKANLGYTNTGTEAVKTTPASSFSPDTDAENSSVFSSSQFNNWIVEPQASWSPRIGSGFLEVLAGATFLQQENYGLAQYANGFSSEALMKNIAAASAIFSATNYHSLYRYQAFFGRVNYTTKDRYIINITGRRDGSSRFGPGKQFAMFGAVGGAWIFSRERFVKEAVPFISFGKLRASYGTTGNDQIGDYQFLDTYRSSGTYYGRVGLRPTRLYNADFAWETNKKLEAGLELGFIKDRILLTTSYYLNRSSNQLVGMPLAPTTGFSSIQGNFAATVENTGIEIELNTRNIEYPTFNWSTSFNLTIPKNSLLDFPNLQSFPAYNAQYEIGEPLDIKKLYQYNGVDPTIGNYLVDDVNHDTFYDVTDRQTIKFIGRDLYGGLLNSLRYKGFQLDVLFQYVKQQGYGYLSGFYVAPGGLSNQPIMVMERWRQAGDVRAVQRFSAVSDALDTYALFQESNEIITEASFIRLKNIYLSYTLPQKWVNHIHLGTMKVFAQGQNLWTATSYKGLDPENLGSALPPLRTITAGLHIGFN